MSTAQQTHSKTPELSAYKIRGGHFGAGRC
jgi:hypothetical protein